MNTAERCRSCHEDEVRRWVRGGHSRSVRPATADTVSMPVPGRSVWAAPHHVETSLADGTITMTTLDADGKRRAFPVSHVVGGSKLEMYITPYGSDRRPQVLPAMYSRRESDWVGYWDIDLKRKPTPAPPESPRFWTERSRNFVSYCNRCHTPRTKVDYDADTGAYQVDWGQPGDMGVGCAACHGDATEHVRTAEAGAEEPARTGRDALPDRSSEGRVHACGRCHVSAEWVSLEDEVDTDFYDVFLPLVLDDVWHFWPDGRHKDHAYLFMNHELSECFRKGHARCESCHDIHGETAEESRQRSLAACNRCHPKLRKPCATHPKSEKAGAVRDCVDCHMPTIVIERGHGRAHDHRISVPDPVLTRELGIPNACNACHTDKTPDWAEQALTGWEASERPQRNWARTLAAGLAGNDAAAGDLQALVANDEASWVFRASAARALMGFPSPSAAVLLAESATDATHPMVRASAAFALYTQQGDGVAGALRKAVRDERRAVRVMAAAAIIVRNQGEDLATAIGVIQEVVAAIPDHKEMYYLLATGYENAGDLDKARSAYERVVRLIPKDAVALRARDEFEKRAAGHGR